MGRDLVFLLNYEGGANALQGAVDFLEVHPLPELQRLREILDSPEYRHLPGRAREEARWTVWEQRAGSDESNDLNPWVSLPLPGRPILPDMSACLHLPEISTVRFGEDVVVVQPLRRYALLLLAQLDLHGVFVDLAGAFCRLFHTEVCVAVDDWSPAYRAAINGATFHEAVSKMDVIVGFSGVGWKAVSQPSQSPEHNTRWPQDFDSVINAQDG